IPPRHCRNINRLRGIHLTGVTWRRDFAAAEWLISAADHARTRPRRPPATRLPRPRRGLSTAYLPVGRAVRRREQKLPGFPQGWVGRPVASAPGLATPFAH